MSNEEKMFVIEFLGEKTDWESWSENLFMHGKHKGYKKLLVTHQV